MRPEDSISQFWRHRATAPVTPLSLAQDVSSLVLKVSETGPHGDIDALW
jgi:hypothetical protein